jgi:predicted ester cyclase
MTRLRHLPTLVALALVAVHASMQSSSAADLRPANAALLATYIADVNEHNVEALKDVIAANYVQHDANQGQGLAGMQTAFRRYFEMFPDFHWTVEDSVVTDDKIVARFQITAMHDHVVQLGPNAPVLQPTGRKLVWQGISIWRVGEGKFVEHWGVDDLLGLMQQMRAP